MMKLMKKRKRVREKIEKSEQCSLIRLRAPLKTHFEGSELRESESHDVPRAVALIRKSTGGSPGRRR